jgi:DNA-directed RNA polymerase subunit beta'
MRGLFATPDHRIIKPPFTLSMLLGHSQLEYFASTYGARKGLADTSLKTANAGFLYKRIMNVAQDTQIVEVDCGTKEGIEKRAVDDKVKMGLAERIAGRTAAGDVDLPGTSGPVVKAGEIISRDVAEQIERGGATHVVVRSPLACETSRGICARCYGLDVSTDALPEPGWPAGVIAAQSLGEPMTQLTMRTFHIAIPPKPQRGQARGTVQTIVGGMPRLDELFEVGQRPSRNASQVDRVLAEKMRDEGPEAAAAYLLIEAQKVYRAQGVRIDDKHFEIVIRRMLDGEAVHGISRVAGTDGDFISASASYGGVAALARAAAASQRVELNRIRNCMVFGKRVPT